MTDADDSGQQSTADDEQQDPEQQNPQTEPVPGQATPQTPGSGEGTGTQAPPGEIYHGSPKA